MTIDILTLFPGMFMGPFDESIVKRAQDKKIAQIHIHNLRQWAIDIRGTVDDKPYGGGVGMVLRPEPIFRAVHAIKKKLQKKVVLLDAGGKLYTQRKAEKYSKLDHLILICGHYEGVDYRVHKHLADEVISIGDYIVTGGEIPAMVITDSIVRLIPGVLIKKEATAKESFSQLKIPKVPLAVEYPQYTRPEIFNNRKVPDVLLSGNHAQIEKWRSKQAMIRTKKNRPDLLKP